MNILWQAILLMISVLLEVFCANQGVLFPLVLLMGFYCFVIRESIVSPLFAALFLDIALGRQFPVTFCTALLVFPLSFGWLRYGALQTPQMQVVPAVAVSLCSFSGILIYGRGHISYPVMLAHLLAVLFFPLLQWSLDQIARLTGLSQYRLSSYVRR